MFGERKKQLMAEIISLRNEREACVKRETALQKRCGIGFWSATIGEKDTNVSEKTWVWSEECKRLVGETAGQAITSDFTFLLSRLSPARAEFAREKFQTFLQNRDFDTRLELNLPIQSKEGQATVLRLICGKERRGDDGIIHLSGVLVDLSGQIDPAPEELHLINLERNGIRALANGLSALAKGDLTHLIDIDFHPKAAGLKADFNQAAIRLHDMLKSVKQTVGSVRRGAAEISSATDSLSKRTEIQAASLEETAAALDQITATVTNTAANTSKVRDVTRSAQQAAEKSGKIVGDTVDAMSRIDDSSRQIGQIIGVIDEIAFQTNLLALNAGVEAARAGDAGKGFAVVAQEVRELAQRSAKAAKEIKALIATSFKHVGEGVALVDETGTALQGIVNEISNVATLINEISSATSEQSAGLHQINIAIRQMDQVTQQNAAMVEETSASTMSLAQEASELLDLTGSFSTSEATRPSTPLRLVG